MFEKTIYKIDNENMGADKKRHQRLIRVNYSRRVCRGFGCAGISGKWTLVTGKYVRKSRPPHKILFLYRFLEFGMDLFGDGSILDGKISSLTYELVMALKIARYCNYSRILILLTSIILTNPVSFAFFLGV